MDAITKELLEQLKGSGGDLPTFSNDEWLCSPTSTPTVCDTWQPGIDRSGGTASLGTRHHAPCL